jgi:hypothetical protein
MENGVQNTYLSARLMHSSGEWISYTGVLVPVKEVNNAQALKSGITLMRRAQMLAICGMSESDDDGEQAVKPAYQSQSSVTATGGPSASKPPNHAPQGIKKLSEAQVNRLWAIAKSNGHSNEGVFKLLKEAGVQDPSDLVKPVYDRICETLSVKNTDTDEIPF